MGAKPTPTMCPLLLRAPCSTLTWLTATYHPHLQQPRTLSRESLSSRGPGVRHLPLRAWRSHWMAPTPTSHIQTWHLSPSSACARPRARGTGASRWYVTHILCGQPRGRRGKAGWVVLLPGLWPASMVLQPVERRSVVSFLGLCEWVQLAIWGCVRDGGWTWGSCCRKLLMTAHSDFLLRTRSLSHNLHRALNP